VRTTSPPSVRAAARSPDATTASAHPAAVATATSAAQDSPHALCGSWAWAGHETTTLLAMTLSFGCGPPSQERIAAAASPGCASAARWCGLDAAGPAAGHTPPHGERTSPPVSRTVSASEVCAGLQSRRSTQRPQRFTPSPPQHTVRGEGGGARLGQRACFCQTFSKSGARRALNTCVLRSALTSAFSLSCTQQRPSAVRVAHRATVHDRYIQHPASRRARIVEGPKGPKGGGLQQCTNRTHLSSFRRHLLVLLRLVSLSLVELAARLCALLRFGHHLRSG
jgi:hypothetical protein